MLRYVALYNHQLSQSAPKSKTPMPTMKDWYALHPHLFKNILMIERDVICNRPATMEQRAPGRQPVPVPDSTTADARFIA